MKVQVMPTVFIPASLRKHTNGVRKLVIDAKNIREVLERLEVEFPGIQDRLCDGDQLRQGLVAAIDSQISNQGLLEEVEPESEVHFVLAVPGG